jgi:aminopeptidase-like protein
MLTTIQGEGERDWRSRKLCIFEISVPTHFEMTVEILKTILTIQKYHGNGNNVGYLTSIYAEDALLYVL